MAVHMGGRRRTCPEIAFVLTWRQVTKASMTATILSLLQARSYGLAQREFGLCLLAILRMLAVIPAIFLLFLSAPNASAAAQETLKGVALVIGQSDYEHLTKLDNPGNDAKRVDALLTGLGFKTDMVDSRSAKRLGRDIDDFIEDAEGADVAVLYYSGHGIEAGGENYLIPVDAQMTQNALDEDKLIKVGQILDELRGKVRIAIILLDACRTNPFPPGSMIRVAGDESSVPIGAGGLAAAKGVVLVDQAENSDSLGEIIGFAAAPGHVALDGKPGTNSPYAAAIVKHLAAKGLDFGK